ncbi:hypothetical protein BDA96_05G163700 [Sorghum bicolor]|uniref:DUF7595 domain-containing protein n=2 Tax=Sorghum bicolor TaxID=4558 RepID=A0A921UGR5_SORBI|nr:uncharacterized protein LOC8058597 [Sorghum bicolor]KAG0530185.1 hypothetical protein BDA96_05G163700 [Sorghum bicolor]KXG28665.1 hypothetical protein SORBI_3005G150200 [Sorghum bicolor]|eukprot:XP_021317870.1 uncharacterized protein LOC8058597 [Sorghum bicolor]
MRHVRLLQRGREDSSECISMDAIAALPEDAQLVIFSHVGNVKDLLSFAMTCKWWVHRFTDPAFLSELFKGNRACLIGFFFQKTRFKFRRLLIGPRNGASISAPTFMLSPLSSLIGPTERSFTAFIPDHDGTFNYAEPLEAHHGIILMQLVPRTFDCTQPAVLLSLCNPMTGECHFLPPLEAPHFSPLLGLHYPDANFQVTMNAIITAADNSNLSGGQLLLITSKGSGPDSKVYIHSYSIDTCRWSTPTRWLEGSRYSLVRDRAAVVHRGAAHWLCTDCKTTESAHRDDENLYKLSVEVGTARVSMTKLPFHAAGSRLLCVSKDDKLSVACIYVMHVTLWTQQEYAEEGDNTPVPWLRTVIRITPDPNYLPPTRYATCRQWFRLNNESLLVLNWEHHSYSIFILDLEKKVMEEVKRSFLHETNREENLAFVPYEIDLVKFFVFRLGRICED